MDKKNRSIGTTPDVIGVAEERLGRRLPKSFSDWLMQHNGSRDIFPVPDERNPRTLAGNIFHEREQLGAWLRDKGQDVGLLLPVASVGDGDLWCVDLGRVGADGEAPIVRWSHETGERHDEANTFAQFIQKRDAGELDD
jgi:hypothetical protein